MSVILQHLINISTQEIDNWHGQVWTNMKPNNGLLPKEGLYPVHMCFEQIKLDVCGITGQVS